MDTRKTDYVDTAGESFEDLIEWMAKQSQSFLLSFGEDTGTWECSWILRDERYTAVLYGLHNAVLATLAEAGLLCRAEMAGGNKYLVIYRISTEEAQ